jgi:hypothetical protein
MTTKADFFSKQPKTVAVSPKDSFYDKVSSSQRIIIDSFVKHFSENWTGIECLDYKSYFGFKVKESFISPNPNWFWLSLPAGASNCLQVKVRLSPKVDFICYSLIFNAFKIDIVLAKLDEILNSQRSEFGLVNAKPDSVPSVLPTSTPNEPEPDHEAIAQFDVFDMRSLCHDNFDFFINDNSSDSTEALLLTGENSPFSFTEKTLFAPETEMRALLKGTQNFDFSIRKWKMVAWSTLPGRPSAVQDVLVLGKKTKCTWLLIHLPTRTVTAFTKCGFYLVTSQKKVYSSDFMNLV